MFSIQLLEILMKNNIKESLTIAANKIINLLYEINILLPISKSLAKV